MKTIPEQDKENVINICYEAVRSGLANGDYLDVDRNVKYNMRDQMANLSYEEQIYMMRDLIGYLRKRIQVRGGRIGIVVLIQIGRARQVPDFLLDCGTAIWGTFFSNKANSAKLRELFLT